jgi:hypothetical protein
MASGSRILDIAEQIDRFNAAIGRAGGPGRGGAAIRRLAALRFGKVLSANGASVVRVARRAGTLKDAKAAIVVDGGWMVALRGG